MTNLPIYCSGIAIVLLKKYEDDMFVLLMKRNSEPFLGEWCYVGGAIEEGEKAWEAALREVREETGLTDIRLYVSNTFEQYYHPKGDFIYMAPVFVGFVGEEEQVKLNEEHSDFACFSFEKALQQITVPGNDCVLSFVEKHFVKAKPYTQLEVKWWLDE